MVGDMAGMLNLLNSSARREEWKDRGDDEEAAATAFRRPDRWRTRRACILSMNRGLREKVVLEEARRRRDDEVEYANAGAQRAGLERLMRGRRMCAIRAGEEER